MTGVAECTADLDQSHQARSHCRTSGGCHLLCGGGAGSQWTTELAAWHLQTKSAPNDPRTAAAYRQLELQTDRLFQFLTERIGPYRVEVTFTFLRRPYQSDHEMIGAVISERRLEVSVAASDRCRLHPLLDCRPGGSYDRFRAVHDLVGHAFGRLGFDADGEYWAWRIQDLLYKGSARLALAAELRVEHAVLQETGDFSDHKALVVPRAYVLLEYSTAQGT